MVKTRSMSKRSTENASTDDMIDQYIRSLEAKATELRLHRKRQANSILANVKLQQEEALLKFRKYDQMTLEEMKNVNFQDTIKTKSIRKNRSKSAKKRKPTRSASRPKKDETPAEPPQADPMTALMSSILRASLIGNEDLLNDIQRIRNNLLKILEEEQ